MRTELMGRAMTKLPSVALVAYAEAKRKAAMEAEARRPRLALELYDIRRYPGYPAYVEQRVLQVDADD